MKSIILFLPFLLFSSPFCNFEESLDLVWIEVASAEQQCITPNYSSLEDAIAQLSSNKIVVYNEKEVNLIVCRACSCPTGIIYQAQIDSMDFEAAAALGWMTANNYEE